MHDFLQRFYHAVSAAGEAIAGVFRDTSGQHAVKTDTLEAAVFIALLTALFGVAGYFGKLFVEGVLHFREERRKYRSALIRYVYDTDIWKNDFAKKFSRDELDKLVTRIIEGPDDLKLGFAASKDEDTGDVMTYIHWLRADEIYSIRLSIAYGELFEGMCKNLSGDAFGGYDRARKLNALINTQRVGLDAHSYATQSLEVLRKKDRALLMQFAALLYEGMAKLVRPTERRHLHLSIKLNEEDETNYKIPANAPGKWAGTSIADYQKAAEQRLSAMSEERRQRLGHLAFPFFEQPQDR